MARSTDASCLRRWLKACLVTPKNSALSAAVSAGGSPRRSMTTSADWTFGLGQKQVLLIALRLATA